MELDVLRLSRVLNWKKKKVSVYECFVVAFVILDFGVRGKWK